MVLNPVSILKSIYQRGIPINFWCGWCGVTNGLSEIAYTSLPVHRVLGQTFIVNNNSVCLCPDSLLGICSVNLVTEHWLSILDIYQIIAQANLF